MRRFTAFSLLILLSLGLQACGQRASLVPPENRVIDSASH
jgi:predicted small lipoprotein YifL